MLHGSHLPLRAWFLPPAAAGMVPATCRCGHGSCHLPLRAWFLAAWLMATHANGISARQLGRQLGLGRYKSAWLLVRKLRRAMVDPDREPLAGLVGVDESSIPFRAKEAPVHPGRVARRQASRHRRG